MNHILCNFLKNPNKINIIFLTKKIFQLLLKFLNIKASGVSKCFQALKVKHGNSVFSSTNIFKKCSTFLKKKKKEKSSQRLTRLESKIKKNKLNKTANYDVFVLKKKHDNTQVKL